MGACEVCQKPTQKRCNRCKSAFYCSKECQKSHWTKHKLSCKRVGDEANEARCNEKIGKTSNIFPTADNCNTRGANAQPAYKCVEITGKGWGMVSTRDIKYGELIIKEKPVITIFGYDPPVAGCLNSIILESPLGKLIQRKFDKLPAVKQTAVMELYDKYASSQKTEDKSPVTIFLTNSFSRGAESDDSVLCLEISRFNHSCKPNVAHAFADPYERVYAVRDISAGEELCTAYISPVLSKQERQSTLQRNFGFTCNCEACTLPKKESELSERRRARYRSLDEQMPMVSGMNPHQGLAMLEEMFEVFILIPMLIIYCLGKFKDCLAVLLYSNINPNNT